MIFCHKPYYNPNYRNLNKKKILMIYALNPKNYTNYTNYMMQNKKNKKKHRKKFRNQNLKVLNYKYLLTEREYLNLLKKSNKFCTKLKENICFLPLCDLPKLIFSTLFEEDIEFNCIISHMYKP